MDTLHTITWHWIDVDGQPTDEGPYLAAMKNTVQQLVWQDGEWVWSDYGTLEKAVVVAWAKMPSFPVR